jgi:hypothetical protein
MKRLDIITPACDEAIESSCSIMLREWIRPFDGGSTPDAYSKQSLVDQE